MDIIMMMIATYSHTSKEEMMMMIAPNSHARKEEKGEVMMMIALNSHARKEEEKIGWRRGENWEENEAADNEGMVHDLSIKHTNQA